MLGPIGSQNIISPTPAKSAQGKAQQNSSSGKVFNATLQTTLETNTAAAEDQFSAVAHERRMNTWLIDTIQRQNACRTAVYNQDMADWKVNASRCRDLGIPAPPEPAAPKLEVAEAKPAGWWFTNNA